MATPITHIVLTNKVFNEKFKDKKKRDFFVGTVFPDIRYLAKIERRFTHSLDFKETNSFKAGIKFHYLIDNVWNEFVRLDNNITSFKFLEDELLYEKINDWKEYIGYFDKVFSDELLFNISKEKTKEWHNILQEYFSKKPDDSTRENFIKNLEFPKERINQINRNVNLLKKDKKIIQSINDFYNNFELLLKNHD